MCVVGTELAFAYSTNESVVSGSRKAALSCQADGCTGALIADTPLFKLPVLKL